MRISLAVTTNTPWCMPQKPPKHISRITGSRALRAPSSSSLRQMPPSSSHGRWELAKELLAVIEGSHPQGWELL
jgi:hypothetical protein